MNRHFPRRYWMANKHMKKCLFTVKVQIKSTRRTTITNLEWLKLKRPTMPSIGKDVEELELSYAAGGNSEYHHFVKQFGSFFKS